MKRLHNIFSISGQIEHVAAEVMMKRHALKKIELRDFPKEVARVDAAGRPVRYAIMMTREQENEFDNLVEDLRA